MNLFNKYQLRFAAGQYWLVDLRQENKEFVPPACINECGAFILEHLAKGLSKQQVAEKMHEEFEVPLEETIGDVQIFLDSLKKQGVEITL